MPRRNYYRRDLSPKKKSSNKKPSKNSFAYHQDKYFLQYVTSSTSEEIHTTAKSVFGSTYYIPYDSLVKHVKENITS